MSSTYKKLYQNNIIDFVLLKVKRIATDDRVIKKKVNDDYFFTTECNSFWSSSLLSRTIPALKGGERVNIWSSIIIHG